jgi:uncharacterized protein
MASVEEVAELIKAGNSRELRSVLENDPALLEQKAGGVSLLQFAAYCRNQGAIAVLRSFKSHLDAWEAATLGELQMLKERLGQNKSVLSEFSPDGFTLLGLACYFGHREVVRFLLEAGADPNVASTNAFRVAPLHSASAISDIEIAALLIEAGADVNAKQNQGVTPLHSAAHNGQTRLAELLIANGADVGARTDGDKTPLQLALEKNHDQTAEVIRNRGGI